MKKTFLFLLIVMLSCATALSAQVPPDKDKINAGLNQFIGDLAATVPNTAINQNVYADAYIGKLVPSVPPHFAVGVNAAFAILDMSGLEAAGKVLGITIPDKFVLPTLTFDARLGGIFLPFDIGFTFMKVPPTKFSSIEVDYLTWGADLRWALLQQGLIAPNISLGIAYYRSQGNINTSDATAAAEISYKINTLALLLQVSKTFAFVTPFVGGRFVMSDADNAYSWSGPADSGHSDMYKRKFAAKGSNQFNVYGGLSFNIFIVRLTPSVSYDFTNKILAGAFSARIQL